jgi:hypothetical protein
MSLAFRDLRLRVRALTAGLVDDSLVESRCLGKLEELWRDWDWSFKEASGVIATTAPHGEGHVTWVSATLLSGTGTLFTAADVGAEIVVANQNSRYTIAAVDTGLQRLTLKDPYAGGPFTNLTYKIQTRLYPLAADFEESAQPVYWRKLVEISLAQLDRYDGRRTFTSQLPYAFRYAGQSAAGVQLVEISPVPGAALGIVYTYKRRLPVFADTDLVPLHPGMVSYLVASDAMAIKALEVAEKQPQAAQIYQAQSDKYQALGLKALQEAQFQDLQLASAAKSVRDEQEAPYYSDDMLVGHDLNSPI